MEGAQKKKICLFCYSYHTFSTKKFCEGVAKDNTKFDFDIYQLEPYKPEEVPTDMSKYDFVGFASGIYAWDVGKSVYKHLEKLTNFKGKKCFTFTVSGDGAKRYPFYLKDPIEKQGGIFLGGFGTMGYQNYFPLSLFGGKTKQCPTPESMAEGKKFLEDTLK